MSDVVYHNGEFVEADRATVSVFDAGLLHGAGLFETMRAYGGVIFRLRDHLARLAASAEALSMFDLDEQSQQVIAEGLTELIARNSLSEARVRLTITTGDLRQATTDDRPSKLTILATAARLVPYPAELYAQGMTVLISVHKQSRLDPTCGFKTLSYLPRLISLREAQARGCGEALWFTHENLLAEGAISNVFIVSHGVVKTPPIDTPILPGVTRKVILEIAREQAISIQEMPLTINDLLDASEVFLTNCVMGIMPVCRVERRKIGDEKLGAVTRRLSEAYRQIVAKECHLDGE
ncbi:MAG: aminotransferase class IV [Phycisphaerae bacterium]|nr:aminotransferase class IV [Phycisphaerae bacterium]